jgi:hypothetical protein
MTSRSDITPELLRQLLDYDPETGVLTWKWRDECWFAEGRRGAAHTAAAWNSAWAGSEAMSCVSTVGYKAGAVLQVKCYAHRVAWALHHGVWPSGEIDHIDGDRLNNRISNLRDVPKTTNAKNKGKSSKNTSGYNGVYFNKAAQKWQAYLTVGGVAKYLGLYDTPETANAAREAANIHHNFHPNHGKR